nr:hypothetical protein GCM10017611_81950 [Rhodococcus wratislaviensis]
MPEQDNRELLETRLPQRHREFVAAIRTKYAVPDDGLSGTRSRFVRSQEMAHAQLGVVLASEVPITAMGVGSPPEAVSSLHDAGKSVISASALPSTLAARSTPAPTCWSPRATTPAHIPGT